MIQYFENIFNITNHQALVQEKMLVCYADGGTNIALPLFNLITVYIKKVHEQKKDNLKEQIILKRFGTY